MIKLKDILSSSTIAFQVGLVARSLGFLFFTIWIAHHWNVAEIAHLESISIFQYVLFFSWFPAVCIVLLRKGNTGKVQNQKSFLFSIMVTGLVITVLLFVLLMSARSYFLPWIELSFLDEVLLFGMMLFYFFLQIPVYIYYVNNELKKQWILSFCQCCIWILLIWCAHDTHEFLLWMNVFSLITLFANLPKFTLPKIEYHSDYWKEVMSYAIYLTFGAAAVIIAAYYVQLNYGVNEELNWFRYGTRELPFLPTLIAGLGQTILIQDKHTSLSLEALRSGITFYIKLLIVPIMILIIFSVPIFRFVYGTRFTPAAVLMSTSLLIYIPRMIPSASILQYHDRRNALLWIGMIEFVFILLSFVFISPKLSLIQVVWIIIAGTVLEKVLHIIVLQRAHKTWIKDYLPVFWFLIWSLVLILSFLIQSSIRWK